MQASGIRGNAEAATLASDLATQKKELVKEELQATKNELEQKMRRELYTQFYAELAEERQNISANTLDADARTVRQEGPMIKQKQQEVLEHEAAQAE